MFGSIMGVLLTFEVDGARKGIRDCYVYYCRHYSLYHRCLDQPRFDVAVVGDSAFNHAQVVQGCCFPGRNGGHTRWLRRQLQAGRSTVEGWHAGDSNVATLTAAAAAATSFFVGIAA